MNTSINSPNNEPANNSMNSSSMNALAEAALKRDSPLSPSLIKNGDATTLQPGGTTDPYLLASAARSMSMMPSGPQGMPTTAGSSNNQDIYLSILNEQRRRSSMPDFGAAPNTTGGMPMMPTAISDNNIAASAHRNSIGGGVSTANFASMVQSQFDSTVTAPSRRRKPNFAEKLHSVLSNKDCRHAIAWLPSGRSFCITDQEEFVKNILPKYFREAKFESFSRRLKRWGFRKVYTTGLSQIIFSHDLFHRDNPQLCKVMNGREKVGANGGAVSEDPQGMMSSGAGQFAPQDQYNMMFQQQQQFQFQQQMAMNQQRASMLAMAQQQGQGISASSLGSVQTAATSIPDSATNPLRRGVTSSPEGHVDAKAAISRAQALMAQALPVPGANINSLNPEDPSTINDAKLQLNQLNSDIQNCEEQLAILQRLKELKEKRRQLTGSTSPRGVSPN